MIKIFEPERLEPFLRDKLFLSIHKSLSHRKTALGDASALTDTILARVLTASDRGIINLNDLRRASWQILAGFDKAAGVHYAAFHNGLD